MSTKAASEKLSQVANKILERKTTRLQIVFQAGRGLVYDKFQDVDFDEMNSTVETLRQARIITSEVSESVLKCHACDSYKFSLSLSCGKCQSTNLTRRSMIEHLPCGNIDFEDNFVSDDITQGSALFCSKCNKRLNAIGVDYLKPGYFFKCNSCEATLPNVDNMYRCFECGKSLAQDELRSLPLYVHLVDLEKLDEFIHERESFLSPLADTLEKVGIRAILPGKLVGESKLEHTFSLVTFDYKDQPAILADVIASDDNEENAKWGDDVVAVMAFHARCTDVINQLSLRDPKKNKIAKLLIAIPKLSPNASKLASTYGITVIESVSKAGTISQISKSVVNLHSNNLVAIQSSG